MKDKNDLKLLDVMCKWYIWAVVGLVIGNWLSDTLGSLIGLALEALSVGIYKNYNKKIMDNFQFVRISGYLWENCGPGTPGPYGCTQHKKALLSI